MDEKIKYIFFVFLGIIFYLIFLKKKELVEGATCRARTIEWKNIGSAADKRWSRSDASRGDCSGIYADVSTIAHGVDNMNLADNVPIKIDNVAYSKVQACRILDGTYCRHQPHVDEHCDPNDDSWFGCDNVIPVQQERCDGGPNRPGLPSGFGGYCSSRPMGNINGSTFCTKTSFCELHCGRHEIRDGSDCKCVRGYGRTNTNSRTDNCEQCDAGYHRNDGEDRCDPCNSGTYQSQAGQNSCELCQLKKYQTQTGQRRCTDISPGHETNQPNSRGATSQVECSYNHYNDTTLDSCELCSNGSEPVDVNNDYTLRAAVKCNCFPGFRSDGSNNPDCHLCKSGKKPISDSSRCDLCPDGKIGGEIGGTWNRNDYNQTCSSNTFTDLDSNPIKDINGIPIRDNSGTNIARVTNTSEDDCKKICGRDSRCQSFTRDGDNCTFRSEGDNCTLGGNSYLHVLTRYDNNLDTWKIYEGDYSEKENLVYETPGFCPLTCPSGTEPNESKTRCIQCSNNTAGVGGRCNITCEGNQVPNDSLTECVSCRNSEISIDGKCISCPPPNTIRNGKCVTENEIYESLLIFTKNLENNKKQKNINNSMIKNFLKNSNWSRHTNGKYCELFLENYFKSLKGS